MKGGGEEERHPCWYHAKSSLLLVQGKWEHCNWKGLKQLRASPVTFFKGCRIRRLPTWRCRSLVGTEDSESITVPHNWLAITHKAETVESAKGPLSASFQVLTLTILGMQDSGDALTMEMGTIKVNACSAEPKGRQKRWNRQLCNSKNR